MNLIRWYYLRKTRTQRLVYKAIRKQHKQKIKDAMEISRDHWKIYKQYGLVDYRREAARQRYKAICLRKYSVYTEFEWMLAGMPYMQAIWIELGGLKV